MYLSDIIGHPAAVRALQNALEGDELAGTYLFVGPQGVGKTSLALAFAQAAACCNPRRSPFDSCGECDSCRRSGSEAQPEIVLVRPAGDQTQIWQFWDRDGKPPGVLQHTLPYAPAIGRRRVYIVERADTLNEPAANSLLKVLEEPPPYALFVLLAPHAARLLPTILSRSQLVRLTPLPIDAVAEHLVARFGVGTDRARTIAACTEGRIGAAITLASSSEVEAEMERLLDLAQTIPGASPLRALQIAETMRKLASGVKALAAEDSGMPGAGPAAPGTADTSDLSNGAAAEPAPRERLGRKQLAALIDLLAAFCRDLLAIRLRGPEAPLVYGARRALFAGMAAESDVRALTACLDALIAARCQVDQNVNPRLITEALAIRLVTCSDH